MATEEVQILRIPSHPSSIEPGQVSLCSVDDANLGYRPLGWKEHGGSAYLALAKDQLARVKKLTILDGDIIGSAPLKFDDTALDASGAGLYARFADDAAEAVAFKSDFNDASVFSAMSWIKANGGGAALANTAIGYGASGVLSGNATAFRYLAAPISQVHLADDSPTHLGVATNSLYLKGRLEVGASYLTGEAQSIAATAGINFRFLGARGESQDPTSDLGHQLYTENSMLSLVQKATETGYSTHAFARAYRQSTNPDTCTSVAELRSWDSVSATKAYMQVKSSAGVSGAGGSSQATVGASFVSILASSKLLISSRIARQVGAITASGGSATWDFATNDNRDIDLNNQATVTVTLTEPADISVGQRSFGIVRLIQGSTTPTTAVTFVSSGSATLNWLTDSGIDQTLGVETHVEVWWDFGKWTLMKPGAGGAVSGLSQFQLLFGAADGSIDQSANLSFISSGDVALSGGSYKATSIGEGVYGPQDVYNSEKILFGLGTISMEATDTVGEGAESSISITAKESASSTDPQIEILGGGAYSGDIAGTLNLRGYYFNIFAPSGLDFNDSELDGIISASLVEQNPSSSSGALSVLLQNGSAEVNVGENITSISFQQAKFNATYHIRFKFSGSYSVAGFSGTWKWSGVTPPISGTSGDEFIVTFKYFGTDGYRAMISEFA